MTQTAAEYDIAITGYACRLPGAPDAGAFWNVLAEGRCVISRIGPDRFEPGLLHDPDPAARGKSYSFAAGQIDDIWGFDPGFFAISPREAAQMDPQQRILLQVVWEALEHAGLTQAAIAGERTGVFVGASSSDHSAHFFTDLARVDAQFMTGNTLSIIANRISYLLDLRGPSFTIDTACSSSLYALHAAAQALMAGEIDTAIVGGVNLLVAPGPFVGFSRATMLSPTGLCRAFDAAADGYVRSEGAVVFVLRRLDRARADGDPVRGILAGTGINSDGRTVGMALPSASRQADLLRLIRDRFGLDPDRLAFIEAHGTGTPVGDPLEARAIGAVYGAARAQPLPIGSAKSNFGHLEPASGLVGLLKAQLALERGQLPATLHVRMPNPNIDFDGLRLALAREPVAIPPGPGPWYAGVNSFGFGGANAHALLRQPRPEERCAPDAPAPARPGPLTLSAASAESLGRLAAAWRARIAAADPAELPDLVAAAAWRREPLPHRLVALGGDRAALIAQLDAHAEGRRAPGLVTGRAPREGGRTALLFSGNGSQWPGMGRHLLASDEAFRARFDEVAALFAGLGGPDLHALIADPELEGKLGSSQVAQPVLFAVQMALVAALAARGLRPDAVAGHSVGEVAAACTAGILSLGDAVHLVHSRSRALDSLRGSGGMAAISAGAAEVTAALAEAGLSDISIAGINSPRSVTVSGDREQLSALLGWLRRKRRVAGVMLDVEIPYHSAAVEPLRARMIEDLRGLVPAPGQLLYASATTGQIADGRALDCDYWWRNARDVVRFQEAVGALVAAGCRAFVEISPRPVLAAYVRDTLRGLGASGEVVRTMDQGAQADTDAAEMVARAHAVGARVERGAFFGPRPHSHPDLPAYPWNNDRFRAPPTPDHLDPWGLDDFHPLIGRAPQPGVPVWRGDLGTRSLPWLADHAVDGAAVFPAAGLVEMALAAGMRMLGTESLEVSDLEILRPLSLEGEGADLRVSGDPQTGALRIEARPRLSDGGWALHAMATVRAAPSPALPDIPPPEGGEELAGAQLYATLAGLGLQYGPRFRLADRVLSAGNRAEAMILGEAGPADGRLLLNPAQLDAALHAVFPILMAHRPADGARAPVFLPVRIGRLRLARAGVAAAAARVEVTRQGARGVELRLVLLDAAGAPVAAAEGVRLQALRLQGRSEREATRWRQRLIRLRAPDARVALPGAWAVPADRLRALGVASESEPEPDAGALLVDAACRRIAWDACLSLADAEGRLDAPPSPLADRILAALAEDGLADPAAGRLLTAAEVPYPPTGELIALLMREAPDRAAELQELMRLETRLADLLRAGGGTEPAGAPAPDTGAGRRAMAAMLGRIAADLVAGWPATDRLSVLLLGAAPASLVATLADSPRVDGVVLSAPSRREVDLMRQTIPARPGLAVLPLDEALTPLRHDVVLSLDALGGLDAAQRDRLAGAMALGGLLVGIEAAPSLMQDLRAALAGRTPDARDARRPEDLPGEAFRDIAALPLAGGAVEAHVVLARPRQQAIRAGRPEPGEASGRLALVVLSDTRPESRDFARLVAASLTTAGVAVRECLAGDDLALQEPASEVIHLAHLPRAGEDGLETAARRIAALRAVMAMPHRPERVWVVTRGGRPATDAEGPARIPAEAALWGAARVLANEVPGTRLHLVDFDPALAVEVQAEELSLLILSGGEEREVVIDAAGMRAPRVEPLPVADAGGGDALRLEIGQQAAIDSLVWRRAARRAPGPGEVEIEVRAAGLNFRDLMWAQGLLPDEALEDGFAGATLGMECAGVVLRAGRGSAFDPGEAVIAFAPASFATHVTVPARAVARLPSGTAFDTAAAVPTIFVTAQYALSTLANLRAGETLLVHGGAGGVGIAAIQIARRIGARVFATAGTPAKRRLLRHLGVEAAFDSRSLAFADEVMAATGGRGVDVVLNALAGEAMERSLACLAPFGRFVELGKRDFYANTRIGLRPFRRNLSYFGVDADQLLKERPDIAERLMAEIAAGFADGSFAPPPCQIFEAAEAVDAFRLMQQSRHVGKVVLHPPAAPAAAPAPAPRPVRGAWLIVGGLGGFGLATARWLAAHGAQALWLVSRSGQPAAADAAELAALAAGPVPVHTRAVDATDRAAMTRLMHEITGGGVPLGGVVHAAMVLDDALSADLDAQRIERVMAPKIRGAEILDALTRDAPPDHFLLYSSVTTLFGNPGQLPYVAANSHLESLAAARRAAGLPGLAIGWGPIADRGYLARDEKTRALLARRLGARLLTAGEALEALGQLLRHPPDLPAVTVAPMRWRQLAGDLALLATPLFAHVATDDAGGIADGAADILALIDGLPDDQAVRRITEALVAETARILRQPASEIDPFQPLTELGFDSLMAMDLKLAAEEAMGVTIPILAISDGMTLAQLSGRILAQLRGDATAATTGDEAGDRLVRQHLEDAASGIDEELVRRVTERAQRT